MTDDLSILARGISPYTRSTKRKVAIVGARMGLGAEQVGYMNESKG